MLIDFLLTGPPGQSNFAVVLAKTKRPDVHSLKRLEKRESEKRTPGHAGRLSGEAGAPLSSPSSITATASSDTGGVAVYQEVAVFGLSSRRSSSSSLVCEKTEKKNEKEEEDTMLLLPPVGRTSISSDEGAGGGECTQLLGVYVHLVWHREILASKTIEKTAIAACFSPPSSSALDENLFVASHLQEQKDLFSSSSVTSWPVLHVLTADFQIESTHIPPFPIDSSLFSSTASAVSSSWLSLEAKERMQLDREKKLEDRKKEEEEASEGVASLRKLQQYMQIEKVKHKMKKEETRRGGVSHFEEKEEDRAKVRLNERGRKI